MTATCDTKDRYLSPKVEEDVTKLYQDLTASRVLCASVILDLKVHQLFLVGPVFWKPWTKILKNPKRNCIYSDLARFRHKSNFLPLNYS
jgi:hypothetical protein